VSIRSRLKVGVDVPWVTSWSEETVGGIGPCATVEGDLAVHQAERPEFGRPLYSINHFRRQRESVRAMLCPMCGEPTRHGDRWTQTGKWIPAGVLRARGLADSIPREAPDKRVVLDAGAIAPGHRVCMDRSLEHCPHLRGMEDHELKPFPEHWKVTATMLEATLAASPQDRLGRTQPSVISVIGFLQLCAVTDRVDRSWRKLL
jgi:hypothetical protein